MFGSSCCIFLGEGRVMFELHSGLIMPLLYYCCLSSVAILAPEAKAKNAAEPEAAPPAADSILGQFWAVGSDELCLIN